MHAPSTPLSALGGIVNELFFLTVPDRWLAAVSPALSTVPPMDEGSDGDEDANEVTLMPSHAWFRLLELETSLGPFAQPALSLRAHTLLSTMRRARLHRLAHNNMSNLRIDATVALALGRIAKPEHTMGLILRYIATARWEAARDQLARENSSSTHGPGAQPRWLEPVLELNLETALDMLPARTTLAKTAMSSSPEASAYLSTPLLVLSNQIHMAPLQRTWMDLFASLVYATAPRTLSWCTDWAVHDVSAPQQEDSGQYEDAWDTEGGISLFAFLGEYGSLLRGVPEDVGAFVRALLLNVKDNSVLRSEMDDLVTEANELTAHGTPAYLVARLTHIVWTFLSGSVTDAQQDMLDLASELGVIPPFSSIAGTAVATCTRLILGDAAGDEAESILLAQHVSDEDAQTEDAQTFAVISAVLGWATFLRRLATALNAVQGRAEEVLFSGQNALLVPAFELRRVLARSTTYMDDPTFASVRDTCIDILTHLCYVWSSSSTPPSSASTIPVEEDIIPGLISPSSTFDSSELELNPTAYASSTPHIVGLDSTTSPAAIAIPPLLSTDKLDVSHDFATTTPMA